MAGRLLQTGSDVRADAGALLLRHAGQRRPDSPERRAQGVPGGENFLLLLAALIRGGIQHLGNGLHDLLNDPGDLFGSRAFRQILVGDGVFGGDHGLQGFLNRLRDLPDGIVICGGRLQEGDDLIQAGDYLAQRRFVHDDGGFRRLGR